MADKKWESYEDVAAYLLNQMASEFDLGHVEGKQLIVGESGATWEIDAKGVKANDKEAFTIIECRRYTTSKLKQEHVGALAYRIIDTKAAGGILVTPIGIQEGAKRIAEKENIINVTLREDSTTENYMLQFLNNIYLGLADYATAKDSVEVVVQKAVTDNGTATDDVGVVRLK